MNGDGNGAAGRVEGRPDSFAVVIYIPDPLGEFLDHLRRELAPGCDPHAHMTVLPPRPLAVEVRAAEEHARRVAAEAPPFVIEAREVEVFPVTDVVYLGVGRGMTELEALHGAMNSGSLAFEEPYLYHPHLTIAQEIDPAGLEPAVALARRRWSAYRGPRSFRAESVTFVQNNGANCWKDLNRFPLGAVSPVR